MSQKINRFYTDLWIDDFGLNDVKEYDRKWYERFEKNVKHRQQVGFVGKYLRREDYWCDCPIGSGRLMRHLSADLMLGFDKSPMFVEFNRKRGIEVLEGDIRDFPFENKFDVISCLNMLFAFEAPEPIIEKLVQGLKPGGMLVLDLSCADHVDRCRKIEYDFTTGKSFKNAEILELFNSLGCDVIEIEKHDFWDNRYFHQFWRKNGYLNKGVYAFLNSIYFRMKLYPVFSFLGKLFANHLHAKYLVSVRKRDNGTNR